MGTHVCFSTKYSTVIADIYCELKIEEIGNLLIFHSLVFVDYIILGRHILTIYKAKSPKPIFHLQLSYQLPDVLRW